MRHTQTNKHVGFYRVLLFFALALVGRSVDAQPMIGIGFASTRSDEMDRQYSMPYIRIAWGAEDLRLVAGIEFGSGTLFKKEQKQKPGVDYNYRFVGFSLGYKLTRYVGAELNWSLRTTYGYQHEELNWVGAYQLEQLSTIGIAALVFTHGMSHINLGYGQRHTWRLGYTVQLSGY